MGAAHHCYLFNVGDGFDLHREGAADNLLQNFVAMPRALSSILLLVASNAFMTFAWYGHLKFKEMKGFENLGLLAVILISWGIAFFEYCLQVPANRLGHQDYGGPFSLLQMKMIQEVITLLVFVVFSLVFFRTEQFRWNHLIGFLFLMGAVFFFFKK